MQLFLLEDISKPAKLLLEGDSSNGTELWYKASKMVKGPWRVVIDKSVFGGYLVREDGVTIHAE